MSRRNKNNLPRSNGKPPKLPFQGHLSGDASNSCQWNGLQLFGIQFNGIDVENHPSNVQRTVNAFIDGNLDCISADVDGTARSAKETQSRLLFVALLENYCNFYGKEAGNLFVLLCAQLIKTGILHEHDLNSQFVPLRTAYKQAFQQLLHQTLHQLDSCRDSGHPVELQDGDPRQQRDEPSGRLAPADKLHQYGVNETSRCHANLAPFNSAHPRITALPISATNQPIPPEWQHTMQQTMPNQLPYSPTHTMHAMPTSCHQFLAISGRASPSLGAPAASMPVATGTYGCSRLEQDFVVGERVGHGAFGSVMVARNRLDEREYAIKRIRFNGIGPSRYRKILREVYSLARLDHQNVVRYHSAWIESLAPGQLSQSSQEDWAEDSCDEELMAGHEAVLFPTQMALYIQMQLCHFTLKDWICLRNELHFNADFSLPAQLHPLLVRLIHLGDEGLLLVFAQIVQGLIYIHSHGFIHRDLKPQNIFFYIPEGAVDVDQVQVKIGDFSLVSVVPDSCQVANKENVPNAVNHPNPIPKMGSPLHSSNWVVEEERTGGVGTCTYASPEQLNPFASNCSDDGQKADIYSLGIIFLELFLPFYSQCERYRVIERLRTSQLLPDDFVPRRPAESAFVLWCTSLCPNDRPSALEIGRLDFLAHLRESHCNGRVVTAGSSMLLRRLREKDELIEELQRKINALQTQLSCK